MRICLCIVSDSSYSHNHTLTHSHTLLITCTCCVDLTKGTQDKDFSYSFFDSLSAFMCARCTLSAFMCARCTRCGSMCAFCLVVALCVLSALAEASVSQVVELLLKHGANPNTVDAEQENALTKAVKSGTLRYIREEWEIEKEMRRKQRQRETESSETRYMKAKETREPERESLREKCNSQQFFD